MKVTQRNPTQNKGQPSLLVASPNDPGTYDGDIVTIYDSQKETMIPNVRQGVGTCTWQDGSIYQGDWLKNQRHGQGTFHDSDGSKYTGSWKNDKKDGDGKMRLADGTQIEARWINGKLHGSGKIIRPGLKMSQENVQWNQGVLIIDKQRDH